MEKRIISLITVLILAFTCFSMPALAEEKNAEDEARLPFEVSADAVYLVNVNTGKAVYSKNIDKKIYPASVTKIMTAIIVLESIQNIDTEVVTVTEEMLEEFRRLPYAYSNCGLIAGEEMTVKDLLYAILLQSASDASNALAYYVGGGSREVFVEKMNQKAAELGLTGTHYTNPHGLHDDDHYTTAYDLYLLANYAIKVDYLLDIASESTHEFSSNLRKNQWLATTNYLQNEVTYPKLYYAPIRGIKTGTTDEAGTCLVSTATKDGYTYILVLMGEPTYDSDGKPFPVKKTFIDAPRIYDWAFETFEIKPLLKKDEIVEEVSVNLSSQKNRIHLKTTEDVSQLIPKNYTTDSMVKEFEKPESVDAPVKEGDILGKLHIKIAGNVVASVDLYAAESVDRSFLKYAGTMIKASIHTPWFRMALTFFVLGIIFFLIAFRKMNHETQKRNRRIKQKYTAY